MQETKIRLDALYGHGYNTRTAIKMSGSQWKQRRFLFFRHWFHGQGRFAESEPTKRIDMKIFVANLDFKITEVPPVTTATLFFNFIFNQFYVNQSSVLSGAIKLTFDAKLK